MITKSKARAPAGLLRHLSRMDTNEKVVIGESRDVSPDLSAALFELAMLGMVSNGVKNLFHAIGSPSPGEDMDEDKWQFYWTTFEKEFGLAAQPFIEVQHLKKGRDHRHRVYSLATESGKLIPVGHNYRRNELVSRLVESALNHQPVRGRHQKWVAEQLEKSFGIKLRSQSAEVPIAAYSSKEHEQAKRKLEYEDPQKFRAMVYELFEQAERDWATFAKSLDAEGLTVARGDRALLVIDTATTFNLPLARLLRTEAKAKGKPIKLKSVDLEQIFGKAKSLAEVLDRIEKEGASHPNLPALKILAWSSKERSHHLAFQTGLPLMPSELLMRPQHDEDNHLFVQPSISWSQVAIPSLAEEVERPLQSPLSSEINRLMTQLLEERQRRARLDNTKIKRQRYGKSAFERIGQKLAVKVAAQLLTEMRRQKLKPRLIILMLTVLAHAHALIPIMFVAAVAVVIRTGVQKAKAGETRSDLDAAAAAQRGFRFNEVSRYDRKAYAFIGNSLLNPGFNPKPAIETLGTEKAARFLTWWVHASSKQRAIVLSWDVDRRQNPPRSLHVKAPTGIAATASSFTVIYPTTKEPEPVPSEDTGQKPPDPTKSTLPKTQVRKKRSRRGKNDWGR